MLVHRLLDVFFRTLDAVDAVRDRVDQVLGRERHAEEWTTTEALAAPSDAASSSSSPPQFEAEVAVSEGGASAFSPPVEAVAAEVQVPSKTRRQATAKKTKKPVKRAPATDQKASKPTPKATKARATGAGTSSVAGAKKKKATSKASNTTGRKGSVDRQGKDFDSPRARTIDTFVRQQKLSVVGEDTVHDGKKVLARVLWALGAADRAGESEGLTTADICALLHVCAHIDVFTTNVSRACRDHGELIVEATPDGRSKRYRLTTAGKHAANRLGSAATR